MNIAYSSIILFMKCFYLRLKAAFVSFLLIWLKVNVFLKDSEVSLATLRLLGITLVPLISHLTSLLFSWLSSDNCNKKKQRLMIFTNVKLFYNFCNHFPSIVCLLLMMVLLNMVLFNMVLILLKYFKIQISTN